MGPTWDPPGSCRPQMGPMLAPWTLNVHIGSIPIFVHYLIVVCSFVSHPILQGHITLLDVCWLHRRLMSTQAAFVPSHRARGCLSYFGGWHSSAQVSLVIFKVICGLQIIIAWSHEFHGISNHQQLDCLLTESWCLISSAIWLWVQQLVVTNNKEDIKALHYWTFVRRIHHWWPVDSLHNGPVIQKVFRCHGIFMPPGSQTTTTDGIIMTKFSLSRRQICLESSCKIIANCVAWESVLGSLCIFNSLAPGRFYWNFSYFQANFSYRWLRYLLWNM